MSSSSHARSVVTVGASRKRREREVSFDTFKKKASTTPSATTTNKAEPNPSTGSDNRLLAGYLAHEFLTKGTLLGQKWDPARAEAAPVSSRNPKSRTASAAAAAAGEKKVSGGGAVQGAMVVRQESYADVAKLLRSDGAHVPGIVNPTQLARWLQM